MNDRPMSKPFVVPIGVSVNFVPLYDAVVLLTVILFVVLMDDFDADTSATAPIATAF